ncbi:hypothetical protein MHYP_G00341480 [Metynnis hypsauchen]
MRSEARLRGVSLPFPGFLDRPRSGAAGVDSCRLSRVREFKSVRKGDAAARRLWIFHKNLSPGLQKI